MFLSCHTPSLASHANPTSKDGHIVFAKTPAQFNDYTTLVPSNTPLYQSIHCSGRLNKTKHSPPEPFAPDLARHIGSVCETRQFYMLVCQENCPPNSFLGIFRENQLFIFELHFDVLMRQKHSNILNSLYPKRPQWSQSCALTKDTTLVYWWQTLGAI